MLFRRFLPDRSPPERGSDITPRVRVQTSGGMAFCTRFSMAHPELRALGRMDSSKKKKKPRFLPVFAPFRQKSSTFTRPLSALATGI
jgi:hypothetical protein